MILKNNFIYLIERYQKITNRFSHVLLKIDFLLIVAALRQTGIPENEVLANNLIIGVGEFIRDHVQQSISFEDIIVNARQFGDGTLDIPINYIVEYCQNYLQETLASQGLTAAYELANKLNALKGSVDIDFMADLPPLFPSFLDNFIAFLFSWIGLLFLSVILGGIVFYVISKNTSKVDNSIHTNIDNYTENAVQPIKVEEFPIPEWVWPDFKSSGVVACLVLCLYLLLHKKKKKSHNKKN